jgi:hypothetical protein
MKYIEQHTGEHKESLHEMFKLKFNPVNMFDIETGEEKTVGGSTTLMTTDQFMDFCDKVKEVGERIGIHFPTVDEYWRMLEE